MDGVIIALAVTAYLVGYVVAAVLLALHVFRVSDEADWTAAAAGAVWGLFWPIFLPLVLPTLLWRAYLRGVFAKHIDRNLDAAERELELAEAALGAKHLKAARGYLRDA